MEVKRTAFPYSYIAVEGLIGAGKTTLAKRLAIEFSGRSVLEEFDDNPFLPRFYEEPDRYAFSVELSFLAQRYHQLKRITEPDLFTECTVADYSLGKSLVFASVTLPADEAALFKDLYSIMYTDLPKPELVVYLYLSMDRVRERIRSRGRSYEQQISVDYLDRLQEHYLDHLQKYSAQSALVVDIGGHDLLKDIDAYERFVELLSEQRTASYGVVTL